MGFKLANELKEQYGDKLEVLLFPCNQHGYQNYHDKEEILNSLKHVRPGEGFISNCTLMEKCEVAGENIHPFWKTLINAMPLRNTTPQYEFENPFGIQNNKTFRTAGWCPVVPQDVIWNFEWFLISPDGKPIKRYHPHPEKFEQPIKDDIKELLS
ncbi:Glutathione peroxidase [Hondaea fermentalgiana]|uniref:Glutathione peroxidase n=1 Tax=Hondaea fermentalgiana TaxID=2315210 RepID=A0A2R5GMS7_9STRA|nr:Glutathione peroxidase [Hondaea fermentalgiana]|eukprot:GBG31925.1 Glutathione peroxidase [Hondaea fermentalgiana]